MSIELYFDCFLLSHCILLILHSLNSHNAFTKNLAARRDQAR